MGTDGAWSPPQGGPRPPSPTSVCDTRERALYHYRMRVAPSEGFTPQSPWLDLVNSRMSDGFGRWTDHLGDPTWVAPFLKYWGGDADGLASDAAVAQLGKLRRLLRRLTEALAAGEELSTGDVEELNEFLRAPGYVRTVLGRDGLATELRPTEGGWSWIRARIVADFVDRVTHGRNRIKVCDNEACRWAFVDETKSNIRRWCHDRRCGNRHRVRKARARQRKSAAPRE